VVNLNYAHVSVRQLKPMYRKSLIALFLVILFSTSVTFVKGVEQGVKLSTPFPSVELNVAQKTVFKITIKNIGVVENTFNLTVQAPTGWGTSLKSGVFGVKSVHLDADSSVVLDFEIVPPAGEKSGVYTFTINAYNGAGVLLDTLSINVKLPTLVVQSGISINSLLPSIEAAAGEAVEFRLNVVNKNTYDELIFFTANYPQGWTVTFTPAYETVTVRSLEFAPSENQVIVAKIYPPSSAEPATYNIDVIAQAEDFKEDVSLSVFIIGKYDISSKPSNDLLSFDLPQGKPQAFNFYVNNTGTAILNDIALSSDKPDGWDIKFDISNIPQLPASSYREVRAIITAPSDAIPGDYAITIYSGVSELGIYSTLNYRVTVKGSVEWGFIGIGIVIALVLVLFLIYWRLGRR
jgi:uncharacterized membrane protein